jgi:putative redox protein
VIQERRKKVGVKLHWDGEMRFVAESETGARVTMDTGTAYGGSGKHPTPMEMLVMALGGCTGMDIVSILQKMRVDLKKFEVEIASKRRQEHPKYYEEIKMTFVLSGDNLTEDKIRKAADLSTEKYCSVGVMLKDKAKITYDFRIE